MITFNSEKRVFHLHNAYVSCVLSIRTDDDGCDELLQTYWGAPVSDPLSTLYLADMREGASFDSLRQVLPYACPTAGRGDYRPALVRARNAAGSRCTELFYVSHRIAAGKPSLPGLPATYTESDDEAQTLFITLRDALTGLEVEMAYTIFASLPVIAASVSYRNTGTETLWLENAGSLALTLPGRYDMLHLHGAWARERAVERVSPARLTRTISSARGASGHQHNPSPRCSRPMRTSSPASAMA